MVLTELPHSSRHQTLRFKHGRFQWPTASALASTYAALLTSPLSGLAGNTTERADVASVAILGYNKHEFAATGLLSRMSMRHSPGGFVYSGAGKIPKMLGKAGLSLCA